MRAATSAAEQVHGPNGVAANAEQLGYGHFVLVVGQVVEQVVFVHSVPVAALVDEPVGEFEVFFLLCFVVELDKGEFYLLMPGHPVVFIMWSAKRMAVSRNLRLPVAFLYATAASIMWPAQYISCMFMSVQRFSMPERV